MSTTVTRSRLLGLGACMTVLAFLLGVPALLIGIGATPSSSAFASGSLSAPDDGTLAMAVISLAAWAAWAVFAATLLLAISARIRGVQVRHIPGLGLPQYGAGQLVAAAALLFVAVPAIAIAASPRALADTVTTTAPAPAPAPVTTPHRAAAVPIPVEPAAQPAAATESYVVKRGDSLWKIAQQHLGDPTKYTELEALNRHLLGERPDFLTPGTVLQVPSPTEDTYVVQAGDTLTGIADHHLGNPEDAAEIFEASRDIEQPDGTHLSDPNLIRPGWRLAIPQHPAPPTQTDPDPAPSVPPTQRSEPDPTIPPSAPSDIEHATPAPTHGEAAPGWLMPGLTGAGALLAGSLLLLVRQQRRTQVRFRRPGRMVRPLPAALADVEKTATVTGAVMIPKIIELDQVLRHLAAAMDAPPRLVSAVLSETTVQLRLAEPALLPAPWTGADRTWERDLAAIPEAEGLMWPYPMLVSIGGDDQGGWVLLNLEEARTLSITGDPRRVVALGRHIAAELALNPWSVLVEVDTLGLGAELGPLDRCHHHHGSQFLDSYTADMARSEANVEPDQFRALIVAADAVDAESVGTAAKATLDFPTRSGAAVILVGAQLPTEQTELHLTSDGRIHQERLGLDVAAAGLSEAEAQACALLVDLTGDLTAAPIPLEDQGAVSDLAGALTPTYTEPRATHGPAGDTSLLPMAPEAYQAEGAATEDLEVLAPLATPTVKDLRAVNDPRLDEDLAVWQSPAVLAPKLTLLGPVKARTPGDASRTSHRKTYYLEMLAYLTLRPAGATAHEVAEAFGITDDRARSDLSCVRTWLGADPRTTKQYLPAVRQSHVPNVHATYQVRGVVSDLDLFRRLRTRGQAHGAEGISDLRTALTLVSGEPFSDLRPKGWAWLLEGERLDHIMAAAIVDTAHLVTLDALSRGDVQTARHASHTGYAASPYDEIARLDLLTVADATGEREEAERILIEDILNRTDDAWGPPDLSARTEEVLHHRKTGKPRIRSVG